MIAEPHLTWNLFADLAQVWSLPSMVNAYRAGSVIAVVAGITGWFLVLRRLTFAAHTIAVAGFPGAAGAVLIGVGVSWGYYGFCTAAALVIAAAAAPGAGGPARDSAVTGVVQAFVLACGMLFVTLYRGFLNGINALLFGTFLGVTDRDARAVAVVAVLVLVVLAGIGRPLLFASIDPAVAAARGVPVRTLGLVFLVTLGVAVAQVSQITGSLLVFALLVAPGATAQRLTARPVLGLVLSVLIALSVTWLGLGAAYFSVYPVGFFITTFAFAGYVLATACTTAAGLLPRAARMIGVRTTAGRAAA
ncbi:MAG TPA: metal ABC transporter permease [Sporichthyaceae bacterium]|jgi:zinc/manganese transport system permease protein|nr:metal ABC transporter permease [Sporichthyaceae bacterium]